MQLRETFADNSHNEGVAFIAMEYVGRLTLRRYMPCHRVPFSEDEVCWIMRQLLEGVKVVHEAGLLQRDIKPENMHIDDGSEDKTRKPIGINRGGFSSLESFCVDYRMPQVTFKQGAMPKLKYLEFKFYAGREREDPVGITHLQSLERVAFRCSPWCESSSSGISVTINVVRKEAKEHPNQISLCINGKEEIFPENKSAQICEDNNVGSSDTRMPQAENEESVSCRNAQ